VVASRKAEDDARRWHVKGRDRAPRQCPNWR
jgi:hypothetical protein